MNLEQAMAGIKVVTLGKTSGLTGVTGYQMATRLDQYVAVLQEAITTVEYRDFEVLED